MTTLYDLPARDMIPKARTTHWWWICFVRGSDGGRHYQHWSLQNAQKEAERLARLTGKVVYLFECVGKCKAGEQPVKWEMPR